MEELHLGWSPRSLSDCYTIEVPKPIDTSVITMSLSKCDVAMRSILTSRCDFNHLRVGLVEHRRP